MSLPKTPAVIATALIIGGWGYSVTRPSPGAYQRIQGGESEPPPEAPKVKFSRQPAAVAAAKVPVKPEPLTAKFDFQRELSEYAQLKTKVLPSEEERRAKETLLNDSRFLRGLGARLVKAPLLPSGEQEAAVDALVDAFKKGDKESAAQAMAEIVEDSQVENIKLATDLREQLAGVKAEVLYHWTALAPAKASQIARRLPGPVSRKIWNNVEQVQQNNLAESALEAER